MNIEKNVICRETHAYVGILVFAFTSKLTLGLGEFSNDLGLWGLFEGFLGFTKGIHFGGSTFKLKHVLFATEAEGFNSSRADDKIHIIVNGGWVGKALN